MTQIVRIFESSKNATEAADELKANNFPRVRLVTEPAPNGKPGRDAVDSVASVGSQRAAETFADSLKNGGAVLCVELPFGSGRLVEQILDRHGHSKPMQSEGGVSAGGSSGVHGVDTDARAAPLSTLLHLPILTDPQPTTLSSLGDQRPTFPTGLLTSDFHVSRLFGLPLLSQSKPWSSLINDPTPLSSWLGLPVLLNGRRDVGEVDQQSAPLDPSEFG